MRDILAPDYPAAGLCGQEKTGVSPQSAPGPRLAFLRRLRGQRQPAAVETKYRCKACGKEWKVRAAA
jgi:hypothetical protein